MSRKRVPLFPISSRLMVQIGYRFRRVGPRLAKINGRLEEQLRNIDMGVGLQEYSGFSVFVSVFYSVLSCAALSAVAYLKFGTFWIPEVSLGLLIGISAFMLSIFYPRVVELKVAKETDREMLGAMRHFMIEVRSGVSIFASMAGLTSGYGKASEEFGKIIKDINGGVKEIDALNMAARRNSSLFFRRAVWQLVNSMRAGSDIATTMDEISKSFTRIQETRIKKYGQELNPMTMMYMIVSIIFPSLGITFLIVLSSFSGISLPPSLLPFIIFILVIFQLFFMGFIKTKRPNISI